MVLKGHGKKKDNLFDHHNESISFKGDFNRMKFGSCSTIFFERCTPSSVANKQNKKACFVWS